MKIDENFDKLLKKANEFEKKEFPMGISIIMQEGITNTLIRFGNEILKDCEKESDLKCENKELRKQLEQAKEIIKQLMYASRDCIAWYCLCDKAKHFLKEK